MYASHSVHSFSLSVTVLKVTVFAAVLLELIVPSLYEFLYFCIAFVFVAQKKELLLVASRAVITAAVISVTLILNFKR